MLPALKLLKNCKFLIIKINRDTIYISKVYFSLVFAVPTHKTYDLVEPSLCKTNYY